MIPAGVPPRPRYCVPGPVLVRENQARGRYQKNRGEVYQKPTRYRGVFVF